MIIVVINVKINNIWLLSFECNLPKIFDK
jgi:hypothetical protein